MKILPPDSISSELLNLIHSANEYLVLVSPYVRMGQWVRLTAALSSAQKRGVNIKAFVRHDLDNASSWEELEAIGIKPRLIANLHAKFYFNETGGLISSLNLLSSSNANSLEIGCKLDTEAELQELKDFVKRYIIPLEEKERPSEDDLYLSKEKFSVVLENDLAEATDSRSRVFFKNNELQIQSVGNSFYLHLDKGANRLSVSGVVSEAEADAFEKFKAEYFTNPQFEVEVNQGAPGYYSMVSGDYKPRLSTTYLDRLRLPEKKDLLDAIVDFVVSVRDFKEAVYAPKRAEAAAKKEAYEAELRVRGEARKAELAAAAAEPAPAQSQPPA
ncbi:hypothetical protein MON38_15010 [Hymenobacter sp. DH14]|uniref:Phospholipase D-like domain-containing protein n=1 Tax=Hymenobacter cyanobacteriorum TaxID=2926463 RepID=A0A9X1VKK4_9BACT|nr:phospholipase D-like domain-containing protein [Hymenobacter cyanobacteriorum]MCI1188735.1 hypothetical protein [Hymenobacter cyanobacteriorum]